MTKYKGIFKNKDISYKLESIYKRFQEMKILNKDINVDLHDCPSTAFSFDVFNEVFQNEVFEEICKYGKNINSEIECFKIQMQFDNCLDSNESKEFKKQKLKEYALNLSNSTAYFYYKKSPKDFKEFAFKKISNTTVYNYLNGELKTGHKSYFFDAYTNFIVNEQILNFIQNLNLNTNTTGIKSTPIQVQILMLDRIRSIEADIWDEMSNVNQSDIIGKLLNRSVNTIRTKHLKILNKKTTLNDSELKSLEECNLYFKSLGL